MWQLEHRLWFNDGMNFALIRKLCIKVKFYVDCNRYNFLADLIPYIMHTNNLIHKLLQFMQEGVCCSLKKFLLVLSGFSALLLSIFFCPFTFHFLIHFFNIGVYAVRLVGCFVKFYSVTTSVSFLSYKF